LVAEQRKATSIALRCLAGTLVNDSTDTAFDCGDTVDYQLGIKMLATQLFRRQVWEADIVKIAFE
jgi:hypothetical protein